MRSWEFDWMIGWIAATIIVLGLAFTIYNGVLDSNQKYYASMDRCISAGGTFIPMDRRDAICIMGNKQ
jgi:hypothetical protein